jgi:threonine dehydrogenase-like Zn-dependent dehydrogenase
MAHLVKAALMGAGQVIAVDKPARRLALAQRLVNAGTVAAGSPGDGPDDAVRAQVLDMDRRRGRRCRRQCHRIPGLVLPGGVGGP